MSYSTETRPDENFPGSNYSDEERIFLQAIERYRRERRRPNLTWHEVLRIVKSLGYRKVEKNFTTENTRSTEPNKATRRKAS
jgi:hypothetical protein